MRDDLADLVHIWEQWMDGDPLLQQALQAAEHDAHTLHALVDEATARLTSLAHRSTLAGAGLHAALYAGWAVVLALEDVGSKGDAFWRDAVHDAEEAHQEALAGGDASPGLRRERPK